MESESLVIDALSSMVNDKSTATEKVRRMRTGSPQAIQICAETGRPDDHVPTTGTKEYL